MVIAAVLLVVLVVFLAQNAHTVTVSFLGVSLAAALLAAALTAALIVGAGGTARITQLRLDTRRATRPAAVGGAYVVRITSHEVAGGAVERDSGPSVERA